jgi:hypothetical protein
VPVFAKLHAAYFRNRRIVVVSELFERLRVDDADVAARTTERYHVVFRYPVQIVTVRHPPFRIVRFVPSTALHPGAFGDVASIDMIAHVRYEILNSRAVVQVRHGLAVPVAQQVHVTVEKPGQHRLSCQVDDPVCRLKLSFDIGHAADLCDQSILHRDGFRNGPLFIHRADVAVYAYDFQVSLLFATQR